jgi:hypothetical protein
MKPLTEERRRLAAAAVGRAESIAQRYARVFPAQGDEIRSAADWAIVKAAASYEPDRGQTWVRWSNLKINGTIRGGIPRSHAER